MAGLQRPPIPYLQVDKDNPLPFRRVEAIIRQGEFLAWDPIQIRLGQIGDGGKRRPTVYEFLCEMEDGLMATFRREDEGIPQSHSKVPVASHAKRHQAVYAVSQTGGFEIAPVCAYREHAVLGRGTLTAMIDGVSFLFVDITTRDTKGIRNLRAPMALEEAYVFDYVVGSGQRSEESLVVDEMGCVRSQCHHEAFSWTESRRLEAAFKNTPRAISQDFFDRLVVLGRSDHHRPIRLKPVLEDLLEDPELVDTFFGHVSKTDSKAIGSTRFKVLP